MECVKVGRYTYGKLNVKTFGNPNELLTIGDFCSIASSVTFLLGGEHKYKGLSTYPFKVKICGYEYEADTKGPIIVEDDVWIGTRSTILSGVKVGKGAIIAAGSTIYKDIPPYAIYGNNKIIKYRFDEQTRKKLMLVDFSKLDDSDIREYIDLVYKDINDEFFSTTLFNKIKKNS